MLNEIARSPQFCRRVFKAVKIKDNMGFMEIIRIWQDLGVFAYLFPYLIFFSLVFVVSFFLINRIRFLEQNNGLKSFLIMIISFVIASLIALIILQFDIVSNIFDSTGYIGSAILFIILLAVIFGSIIVWISMLVHSIKRESTNDKVFWILTIIFGGLYGAWIYFFIGRKAKKNI